MCIRDSICFFIDLYILVIYVLYLHIMYTYFHTILLRRRKQEAIDELAGVFSYTAELLAAGDEVREAIFNCYE